eukprot:CAMPEP_0198230490 /NCGR_PEP_ID=MMETSP1445-20131203/114692_1 /TAXON_ID=36898 /ORGANISM="Pyramimonas sp., Strain CCMP2087" /LENGTH=294 /DNA_ID=CAMNT_0043911035 /DNA_START=51 /DNA_END=935 /DNA_ORIENTATION=-
MSATPSTTARPRAKKEAQQKNVASTAQVPKAKLTKLPTKKEPLWKKTWVKVTLFFGLLIGLAAWLEVSRTNAPIPGIGQSKQGRPKDSGNALKQLQTLLDEHHKTTRAELITFFHGKESDQFGQWWQAMDAPARAKMIVKSRNLLWTDDLLMMMMNQAGKEGENLEEVANKTMHVFAPELFAEEPLAKDSTSLAFLLKAVLDGKEHSYYDDEKEDMVADDDEDDDDEEDKTSKPQPGKSAQTDAGATKSKPEAPGKTQERNAATEMIDGVRKTYRSVLLSSFMQKLILTFKANF